jgi:hypothetical protein
MMQGLIPYGSKRISSSPKCLDWLWGQSNQLFSGYWGVVFLRIGWLWQEVDHIPLYVFVAWTGATFNFTYTVQRVGQK